MRRLGCKACKLDEDGGCLLGLAKSGKLYLGKRASMVSKWHAVTV